MIKLFFAWLNFGIILALGYYVYQRWFKAQLHLAIQTKKNQLQGLQNQVGSLENQIKELSIDLVLQQNKATDLVTKLQLWQTCFVAKQAQQADDFEKIQIKIEYNNQIKLQNLSLGLAQKAILAETLFQTNNLLREKFENLDQANLILKDALTKLNRSAGG